MTEVLRNTSQNFDGAEKKKVLEQVFAQYDANGVEELTPIQVQILHGDLRMGGISLPQVFASVKYICATNNCHISELYDLIQEMDRRYFLIQDFRWEFSFLDREQKQSITVAQAKWFVQSVHGRFFSPGKWSNFVKSRAVPGSGVTFAEIEVMLCDIPSKQILEEEERERERLQKERQKRKEQEAAAAKAERMRRQQEREAAKKLEELENKKAEEERLRREREEAIREKENAERKLKEDEEERERLKRLEEEERRKREADENLYKDAELHKEAAEKAEKDADNELAKLESEKDGADEKKRKMIEEEEERQRKLKKDNKNKRIRYQLKVAIKAKDKYQLEFSMTEFKNAKLSDDDMDYEKAKRLLRQLSAKEGLQKAMTKREIEELDRAMTFVRKHGLEVELASEMMDANKLLSHLRRLERIRHEILELKQSTVAEIRSYTSPPLIVHTVMTATFLLLGHKEGETKDWKAVQALVGKTGKESLKRRCLELDAKTLALKTAKKARKLLEKYELDDVRDISAGAATFFVWATAMIEEAFALLEQESS
ncbi:trichohyalin [Aplysia californica]|uniref:Trichohyalin n=1 Tax=Aplysia californica TaxID=6500 RepID=A0ABM1VTS9_APLCA|nr:trichohyalin [Aplysia californica]